MKKIFLLIILLAISGCTSFYMPFTLESETPEGPPEYVAGWRDGCKAALGSGNTFLNGRFFTPTFGTGVYQHDPLYQAAFGSALYACVTTAGAFTNFPANFANAPLE